MTLLNRTARRAAPVLAGLAVFVAPLAAAAPAQAAPESCGNYCGTDHVPTDDRSIFEQALNAVGDQVDDIVGFFGG